MVKKITLSEKIFVAGATGMAGNAICKALFKKGYGKANGGEVLKPSRKELDLLDTKAVKKWPNCCIKRRFFVEMGWAYHNGSKTNLYL